MREQIEFMRAAAMRMRDVAAIAPEIAQELRRLAEQLEEDATDLARRAGNPR
jgi:hypothetical protein